MAEFEEASQHEGRASNHKGKIQPTRVDQATHPIRKAGMSTKLSRGQVLVSLRKSKTPGKTATHVAMQRRFTQLTRN
ncbi:hypothetical protein SCLCIDRAFT_1220336 [Scleroderma citrinum Foug A]|uniref:Uncharacterized protein n=1 Tax=Scleroderma citrinum Foug A TaxID=1036808 RepID=A0A0C3DKD5_9AGAM|nr:hypothetical protein SCLCIDRAFT_1220336 [Scleroderma citrinum Foug A]